MFALHEENLLFSNFHHKGLSENLPGSQHGIIQQMLLTRNPIASRLANSYVHRSRAHLESVEVSVGKKQTTT